MPDQPSPPTPAAAPKSNGEEAAGEYRVPRNELIAYSLPEGVNTLASNAMSSMANPILVTTMGIAPGIVGIILMLRGLWDAVTDPVMGFVSDNARTRMGRRRPFIIIGAVMMALTMTAAWMFPVDASQTTVLTFFAVGLVLFATSQTVYAVPYGALGLELSQTYHGRTRVQMAKALAGRIAYFGIPYLFPFCLLGIFPDAVHGMRWLTGGLAVLMVIAAVIAGLTTRERMKVTAAKDNFFRAISETFRSPDFLRIAFIYVVLLFTVVAFGVFNYFLGIYYVFGGNVVKGAGFLALVETLANVLALAGIPIVTWICKKYGKHNALKLALWMMIIGSGLQYVLLNPEHPYLMFISPFFYSMGIVSTFMVLGTMMADVVDADELRTHRRREGLFSATAAFMMKTVVAVATGLSGFLVEATGFDIALEANQAPGVFHNMLLLFSGKCVLLGLCLLVLRNYPLTEARVLEIQAILRRRGEFPEKPAA